MLKFTTLHNELASMITVLGKENTFVHEAQAFKFFFVGLLPKSLTKG